MKRMHDMHTSFMDELCCKKMCKFVFSRTGNWYQGGWMRCSNQKLLTKWVRWPFFEDIMRDMWLARLLIVSLCPLHCSECAARLSWKLGLGRHGYISQQNLLHVCNTLGPHTHTRAHTHTRTHTSIWHWKLRDLWYFLNLNQRYWSRSLVAVKKRQTEHHRLYCWRMVHRDHLDQPVDSDLRRGLAILQVSVGSARLYIEIPSKY